jgi:hypothetical protein
VTSAGAGSSSIASTLARTLDDVTATAAGLVSAAGGTGALAKLLDAVTVAGAAVVGGVVALGGGILAPVTLQSTAVASGGEPSPGFPSRRYAFRTTAGTYGLRTVPA